MSKKKKKVLVASLRNLDNPNLVPPPPTPKGNNYGLAIKDPETRQKAYQSFCDHLAKGKAIKSWWYEDGDVACTWATMLSYIKDEAEFNPIKRLVAESQGYNKWENIAEQSADGNNKNANTASLQMVMRNKFGWDKEQRVHSVPNDSALTDLLESLKKLKGDNGAKPETNTEFPGS